MGMEKFMQMSYLPSAPRLTFFLSHRILFLSYNSVFHSAGNILMFLSSGAGK